MKKTPDNILAEECFQKLSQLKDPEKCFFNALEELKEAQKNTEKEKNRILAIIDNFSDGIMVFDKENNLVLINPKAEDFFGLKGKNITGKSIIKLARIASLKLLLSIFKIKKDKVYRETFEVGENLILEMTTAPIFEDNNTTGILVILHDVSREKLVEKMKSEFVFLSAHQLRTPLSVIKWIVKMVIDEDLGPINKEQKDFLYDAYKSNEKMIQLITDLLDVAKIEEGKYLYEKNLADMEFLINSVLESFKKAALVNNIKVKFNKPDKKTPKTLIDIAKMKVVVNNLLDNAVKYSGQGKLVTISLKNDKNNIEVSVKDQGIGIVGSQQKKIFSKFFRGEGVITKGIKGAGLGLFITKSIVEAHCGKIWFNSKKGKGTTFYFTIPIKKF
jgi:two-component system sensor histidine kinase VicK